RKPPFFEEASFNNWYTVFDSVTRAWVPPVLDPSIPTFVKDVIRKMVRDKEFSLATACRLIQQKRKPGKGIVDSLMDSMQDHMRLLEEKVRGCKSSNFFDKIN